MTATVKVDQVLKGTVPGGVITVEFPRNPDILATTLDQNDYGLLFLTGAHDGAYTFADSSGGQDADHQPECLSGRCSDNRGQAGSSVVCMPVQPRIAKWRGPLWYRSRTWEA
jgi:hypothetical protein